MLEKGYKFLYKNISSEIWGSTEIENQYYVLQRDINYLGETVYRIIKMTEEEIKNCPMFGT